MDVAAPDPLATHHDQVFDCAKGIETLAGKAVCADVILSGDLPWLMATAAASGEREGVMLRGVDTVAALLSCSDPPPPCMGCNRPIADGPYAVMVVSAGVTGSPFLAGPVCTACGTEADAIRQAALPTLRLVWPGFRPLPPAVNAVGRA